uniref:Uncharacterized protein n=1 Tax=Ananas comosus var. bracteatus TaxID=296719 RepID=A0A6V7PBB4_ANACO|nr:unnamed protein product [Ananas comosus var. bracteatus]
MATVNVGTLIRSVAAPPPPPPRAAAPSVPAAPRRLFLLLCSATAATPFITSASSSSAAAFSLGIQAAPDSAAEKTKEVRSLLHLAARDCVPEQRNSLVAFQSQTGVEVCTFRLLVNNAASLLDNGDPVKLEAEARLAEVIRLFSSIGSVINQSNLQLDSDREKLKEGLTDTISALDEFEQGIKDCLGI